MGYGYILSSCWACRCGDTCWWLLAFYICRRGISKCRRAFLVDAARLRFSSLRLNSPEIPPSWWWKDFLGRGCWNSVDCSRFLLGLPRLTSNLGDLDFRRSYGYCGLRFYSTDTDADLSSIWISLMFSCSFLCELDLSTPSMGDEALLSSWTYSLGELWLSLISRFMDGSFSMVLFIFCADGISYSLWSKGVFWLLWTFWEEFLSFDSLLAPCDFLPERGSAGMASFLGRFLRGTTSGMSKVVFLLLRLPYRFFWELLLRGPLGAPSSSKSDIMQCFSRLSTSSASKNSSKIWFLFSSF